MAETRVKFNVSVATSNVTSGNKRGPFLRLLLGCHTRSEAGKGKASASVRRNKLHPIEAVTVRYPSTGSRQDLTRKIHFLQLPCEEPR